MEIKQAYPTPSYRDQQNRTKSITRDLISGINNFELCCNSVASGVIRLYTKNDTTDQIAIQVVDQAISLMKEMESRNLS